MQHEHITQPSPQYSLPNQTEPEPQLVCHYHSASKSNNNTDTNTHPIYPELPPIDHSSNHPLPESTADPSSPATPQNNENYSEFSCTDDMIGSRPRMSSKTDVDIDMQMDMEMDMQMDMRMEMKGSAWDGSLIDDLLRYDGLSEINWVQDNKRDARLEQVYVYERQQYFICNGSEREYMGNDQMINQRSVLKNRNTNDMQMQVNMGKFNEQSSRFKHKYTQCNLMDKFCNNYKQGYSGTKENKWTKPYQKNMKIKQKKELYKPKISNENYISKNRQQNISKTISYCQNPHLNPLPQSISTYLSTLPNPKSQLNLLCQHLPLSPSYPSNSPSPTYPTYTHSHTHSHTTTPNTPIFTTKATLQICSKYNNYKNKLYIGYGRGYSYREADREAAGELLGGIFWGVGGVFGEWMEVKRVRML